MLTIRQTASAKWVTLKSTPVCPLKPSSYDRKVRAQPRTETKPAVARDRTLAWRLLLAVRSRRTLQLAKPSATCRACCCSDSTPHGGGTEQNSGQGGGRSQRRWPRLRARTMGGSVRWRWMRTRRTHSALRLFPPRPRPRPRPRWRWCVILYVCPLRIVTCRCRGIQRRAKKAQSPAIAVDGREIIME